MLEDCLSERVQGIGLDVWLPNSVRLSMPDCPYSEKVQVENDPFLDDQEPSIEPLEDSDFIRL